MERRQFVNNAKNQGLPAMAGLDYIFNLD